MTTRTRRNARVSTRLPCRLVVVNAALLVLLLIVLGAGLLGARTR